MHLSLDRRSQAAPAVPVRGVLKTGPAADTCTAAEVARGLLEMLLVVAGLVIPLLYPSILTLALMAVPGFLLVAVVAWDDASRSGRN